MPRQKGSTTVIIFTTLARKVSFEEEEEEEKIRQAITNSTIIITNNNDNHRICPMSVPTLTIMGLEKEGEVTDKVMASLRLTSPCHLISITKVRVVLTIQVAEATTT